MLWERKEYFTYPGHHYKWDKDTRPQPLEQDVSQRLEDGVRDEKYSECCIVLGIGHVQVCLKTDELRIADICP